MQEEEGAFHAGGGRCFVSFHACWNISHTDFDANNKKPRKKINSTVPLGSLNLSDNVKYNNKTIEGTNVNNTVVIAL